LKNSVEQKYFEINRSPSKTIKFEENTFPTLKIQTLESGETSKTNSLLLICNSRSLGGTETPKQVETDWNFRFKRDGKKEFSVNKKQRLWRNHRFKTLIFNPEAKDATFDIHFNLMQKSLHYIKTKLKTSKELMVNKNFVKLASKSIFSLFLS